MARIAVVGNATRDLNRTGLIASRRPGGTLLYASLALHAMGHEVVPIGNAPLRAYIWLRRSRLDLDHVSLAFPGTQFLNEYEDGQRTQWARRGPQHALEDAALLEGVDAVLLGPVLGEVPEALELPSSAPSLLDLQGSVRRLGEPNLWGWRAVEVADDGLEIPPVSHVRGSFEEVGPLIGRKAPEQAVRALHERTGRPSVVTLGPEGALAFDGELHRCTTHPVEIPDPTGAGDVFDAGFVHGLTQGADLEACMALGCAAAGLFLEAAGDTNPRERFADRASIEDRAGLG